MGLKAKKTLDRAFVTLAQNMHSLLCKVAVCHKLFNHNNHGTWVTLLVKKLQSAFVMKISGSVRMLPSGFRCLLQQIILVLLKVTKKTHINHNSQRRNWCACCRKTLQVNQRFGNAEENSCISSTHRCY
uniref:Uncharacterized protein n=1 Tax=Sphaerodactylus townsendi TaxID=933632 RepID=A0ACB8FIF1_9SAUR